MRKMQDNEAVQKVYEEFSKFKKTMEELHFLKLVAKDLESFRRMIKVKRYD